MWLDRYRKKFSIEGGDKDLFTERGRKRWVNIGSKESREVGMKSVKRGRLSRKGEPEIDGEEKEEED